MANNNETQVILVNPNNALTKSGVPNDFKTSQPDDLTIFVELTSSKKNRGTIDNSTQTYSTNGGNIGKVNFISGSDFDGKNRSLTTSYTDIASAIVQSNDNDLEGLGIESIDITFDTAYTPLIKIRFIDVRGGMFQQGTESKYSVFFELPYPIFNLKVKGYYGRTVSYCLHLVKFNSIFNSTTGNFEIDAEFIGYTFAILADLLIGYMRAIPYVSGIGEQVFREVKEKYESVLIAQNNLAGNEVITIDEMFNRISDFKLSLGDINQNSGSYQKLVSVKKSTDIINAIKSANNKIVVDLQSNSNGITGNQELLFLINDNAERLSQYTSEINDLIVKLEELLTEGLTNVQKQLLNSATVTTKIKISDFIDSNGNFIVGADRELIDSVRTQETKYDINIDRNQINNVLEQIEFLNQSAKTKKLAENGFVIYDFFKFKNTLNDIIDANSAVQEQLVIKYQEELRNVLIQRFNFNPSVSNIFRIIMASGEAFIRSVHRVSVNAENNDSRKTTLAQIIRNIDIGDSSTIFAFPNYVDQSEMTNGTQQIEEKWLGSNRVIDKTVVDELIFVEELLRALVERKQADINRESDVNNSIAWFSINPIDTPINRTQINPYYKLSTQQSVHPDDYMRLLMYRTFTYLGLSNPYGLDEKTLKYMAKFEANNIFYGFPKSSHNTANQTIKALLYQGQLSDANSTISHWLSGSDNITNYVGVKSKRAYMLPSGDTYNYRYISQYSPTLSATTSYIPVSGDYSGEGFFEGGKLKNFIELRETEGETVDYLGNYINDVSAIGVNKRYDGAKYIDIIPLERYNSVRYSLPKDRATDTIGNVDGGYVKDLGGSELKENTLKSTDLTTQFDPINYKFYSNEFFTMKSEGNPDRSNMPSVFIQNTNTVGTRLSTKDGNIGNVVLYNQLMAGVESIIIPDISFVSVNTTGTNALNNTDNTFSLFGSPLYYAQNGIIDETVRNYAKSYLFLNTLPLTGIYSEESLFGDNTLVNGIFSKNAGFIKAPSVWVAWVGSLLWRLDEYEANDKDPIITKAWHNGREISIIRAANDGENKKQYQMPSTNELFYNIKSVIAGTEAPMYFKTSEIGYKPVDSVLLGLPDQAKIAFIEFFQNWSDNQFKSIKAQYELLNDNFVEIVELVPSGGVEMGPWSDRLNIIATQAYSTDMFSAINNTSPNSTKPNINTNLQVGVDNPDGRDSVDVIRAEVEGPTSPNGPKLSLPYASDKYFLPYFKIKLSDDSNTTGNRTLRQLLREESIIVNYTPRTFKAVKNATTNKSDITINTGTLEKYLGFLTQEYKRLYDAEQQEEVDTSARDAVFGSGNLNIIKLSIYRHLKSINDKWIYSDDANQLISPCGDDGTVTLFNRFLFIDKNWENIGDEFILNPIIIEELIRSKYNQSLYDVISNVLSSNNFNFIPLPNYVEYTKPEDMENNIFRPYPYVDMVKNDGIQGLVGPKFICMYVGQISNHLKLKGSLFPDDGMDLNNTIPGLTKKNIPIPAFEVNYGTQNQNFFKDVKLDQREFVETQESLEIIDSISDTGDKNKVTFASQNLFNVYQTRSYSAEISSLGMPLIQPMMYFQLNNIPMFRGAYLIINTSHSIKPNHMTTSFKGVRVKKYNTPINKQVLLLKDLNIAESNLKGQKYDIRQANINNSATSSNSGVIGSPRIDTAATGDYYVDGFRTRSSLTSRNVLNFDRPSNTNKNGSPMTYNEIFTEISNTIGFDVDALKVMSIMESQGGINKGGGFGMNTFGFVGLMQFGRGATLDVTDEINQYLSNLSGYDDYEFFGPISSSRTLIYPPDSGGNWTTNTADNNRYNNSMFDDYISTLAGVYYAIQNFPKLRPDPNSINVTDVYLAHQQGKGGFNSIVREPLLPTTSNMENNYPPPYKKTSANRPKQRQEWYAGWAGNVDGASYRVNPNFIPKSNSDLYVKAKGGSTPDGAIA